jgi:ABC-2 type transport system ATP-binding protein
VTAVAELHDVHKRFGQLHALRGLSLEIAAGEVLAVLGPNGAGKTTAIAILLGLRRADAGCARVLGRSAGDREGRSRVGVTPQDASFPPTLRVGEVVELVAAHYPAAAPPSAELERFGLRDLARRQTGGLSGGERRRLALALAFVGRPDLLVLDEPTAGLDANARAVAWAAVRDAAAQGRSVLLTTHHLDEAEALASRAVVMREGREVASGTPADIRARNGRRRVRFRGPEPAALPPRTSASVTHGWCTIECDDAATTIAWLVERGVDLRDVEAGPLPLEEALSRLETEAG